MKRIDTFKSFTDLRNQLREEQKMQEQTSKIEKTANEFAELLKKYNAASVAEISEEQLPEFMAELLGEATKEEKKKAQYDRTIAAMQYAKELKAKKEKEAKDAALTKSAQRYHRVKESVEMIEEGTRGFFGKIDKNGNIKAVYTHYDSYPEYMLPTIQKGYMDGKNVDDVIGQGDNSGLDADINKIKFYNDKHSMTPMVGKVDKATDFIKKARSNSSAEFVYLFDERTGKWMMADTYKDRDLKPAFESVVVEEINEGKRENGKVVTAWKKTGLTDLNAIAKVYADAMEDANFHKEMVTSKAIGAASKSPKTNVDASDIAAAADWSGYAIANGTVEYLNMIGEEGAASKLLTAITKYNLNESTELPVSLELVIEAAGDFAGWIALFNGKKVEIKKDEAKDLWSAKKLAIAKMKVPKSKESMVAIAPAVEEAFVTEAEVDIHDEVSGVIADLYSKLNDLAEETTDTAWRKAIETIIKSVENVEKNIDKAAYKLGVVPTHESEEMDEAYDGTVADFKYDLEMAVEEMGISPIAIKKVSKKGKGFEVRMSSYMSQKGTWESLAKAVGAELVDFQKGSINVGVFESLNEAEIKTEEEFRAYAETVLKKAHGEKYDEAKAKEAIDGIIAKVDGDFGAAVGMLTSGLGESVVNEGQDEEQTAMELYVKLVDPKSGKYSQQDMEKMQLKELEDLAEAEGLKGKDAKEVAKELLKIARG